MNHSGPIGARIRLAAIVAAIVAPAAIGEASVRLAMPAFDPSNHLRFEAPRADRPALGKPGSQRQINNVGDYDVTVVFNRHGFRDHKDLSRSGPGDIFVVGDSFAFGWGVAEEDRFSDRLERRLGRRVFNISSPVNIAEYPELIAYASARGARIERLVVAVNMYDDLTPPAPTQARGGTEPRFDFQALKGFLIGRSALYFLVTRLAHDTPSLKRLLMQAGAIRPVETATAPVYGLDAIERAADVLAGIAGRVETTILLIPDSSRWTAVNREDAVRTQRLFTDALARRGLDVVDLVPAMEADSAPLRHQFSGDRHWKPSGHELAARALASALEHK